MATTTTDAGTLVEQGTPLTRNHWFDGKFLRADDLARDQDYHRAALRLANQAGGFGVVHGLEVSLAGPELVLQPGLGITADGEMLMLSSTLRVGVDALIAATEAAPAQEAKGTGQVTSDGRAFFGPCSTLAAEAAPVANATGWRIYRLTLGPHSALCGYEDVVGALCERACVTERQRPYRLEGVRLRARLQALAVPPLQGIEAGGRHSRSRIASALFALDDGRITPLPDDGGRLLSPLWCTGTGFAGGGELTLGYLVRGADTADFVDLWSGRRERMAPQAQGYWQRRTRLRPFADFIAQVAQFQCQLTQLFDRGDVPVNGSGDCEALRGLVRELQAQLKQALGGADPGTVDWTQAASVKVMQQMGRMVQQATPLLEGRADRLLPDRGIVELPPAGFLPVSPQADDIGAQVQRLVGPGVRLQVCSAPLDAIGHLFQEAQHSARIPLTDGLADPAARPRVQVIVPDGQVLGALDSTVAPAFSVELRFDPLQFLTILAGAGQREKKDANAALKAMGDTVLGRKTGERVGLTEGITLVDRDETPLAVASGIGRLAASGLPPGFALAARAAAISPAAYTEAVRDDVGAFSEAGAGKPFAGAPLRETPAYTMLQQPDAVWLDLNAGADPFAVAPGETVRFDATLRETLPGRGGSEPTHGMACDARIDGSLRIDEDTTEAQRSATALGLAGAEVRQGRLRATIAATVRAFGPGAEDAVEEVLVSLDLPVLLARQSETGKQRWTAALSNPKSQQVLMVETDVRTIAAAREVRVKAASLDAASLAKAGHTHGFPVDAPTPQVLPLASLREDAALLEPTHPQRAQVLGAIARIADALADPGFAAAARRRLFGEAPADAMLRVRAMHDWVLFRRPVNATCGEAGTPPVLARTRYLASVLRLVAGTEPNEALERALKALAAGKMPSTKLFDFAIAAELAYTPESLLPDAGVAALQSPFEAAGFGRDTVLACLQGDPATPDALEQARFATLARSLGGTAGSLQVQLLPELPPPMQAPGAHGAVVYVVLPRDDKPPPPPPTPAPVTRGHRTVLVNRDALAKTNLSATALLDIMAGSQAQVTLDRLLESGADDIGIVHFSESSGAVESSPEDTERVTKALADAGGFLAEPRAIAVAQLGATAKQRDLAHREATFLLGKVSTGGQADAVIAGAPLDLASGGEMADALLLLPVARPLR